MRKLFIPNDTSAVAISVALDAKECQIFTDVDLSLIHI